MPPVRLLGKKSIRTGNSPYVRDKSTLLNNGNILSKTLATLRGSGFDVTHEVLDKDTAMVANGGYCDVFTGHVRLESLPHRRVLFEKDGKVKIAIKRIRARLDRDVALAKALAREMSVWAQLDHPNILPFLGFMLENDYPSLISEWMALGTVRDFLESHPEFDITTLALGVAEGLKYIHDLDIVHSDMKADNILIGENRQPLICDFGISRMLDSSQKHFVSTTHSGQTRGSTRWMAIGLLNPEEGVEPKHSKATDVWAFGMALYEMVAKTLPYAHLKQDVHVLLAVVNGQRPSLPRFRDRDMHLSSTAYSMICELCRSCWAVSPKDRPKMAEIGAALSCVYPQNQSRYRVEVENIRTIGDAIRFYDDTARMLEQSEGATFPLQLHEFLVRLIKTMGHGLDVPDPSDNQSICLSNASSACPEPSGGEDSDYGFFDFTAYSDDDREDTPELVPTTRSIDSQTWGKIENSESGYYNSSMWEWDRIPPSSGWAIST